MPTMDSMLKYHIYNTIVRVYVHCRDGPAMAAARGSVYARPKWWMEPLDGLHSLGMLSMFGRYVSLAVVSGPAACRNPESVAAGHGYMLPGTAHEDGGSSSAAGIMAPGCSSVPI